MRKTFLIGMVLILMLFLLPSCAAGISREEYDRVGSDLAAAQTQIQSLQSDGGVAGEKCIEALAYAEYLDILMNPVWKDAGLTPRFAFEGDFEWMIELRNRASDMGDAELSNYLKELEKRNESAMNLLWGHCLDRIEKVLK